MQQDETTAEHIVVVGAGPAGLAVSLGLHRCARHNTYLWLSADEHRFELGYTLCACDGRKGVRSVVLESSPALRASGYAITTWPNAFRALDALGVGDKIRKLHLHVQGLRVMSSSTGQVAQELDFSAPQQ